MELVGEVMSAEILYKISKRLGVVLCSQSKQNSFKIQK